MFNTFLLRYRILKKIGNALVGDIHHFDPGNWYCIIENMNTSQGKNVSDTQTLSKHIFLNKDLQNGKQLRIFPKLLL